MQLLTCNYLYSGAADLYAETGEKALMVSLEAIWEDAYMRKSSITGGLGNQHFAIASYNPKDMTSESFGYPYKLENAMANNEKCANFGGAYFSWANRGEDEMSIFLPVKW